MGYGFALLPTADNPTSTMSFRLTPDEKKERDEWMVGAKAYGMTNAEIAYEVGLSEQRVQEILRKKEPKKVSRAVKRFKTPRDAALYEFEEEEMHPHCLRVSRTNLQDMMCNDCFGRMMILESEYDANGWPYSWAMYGQEKYIAQVIGK